MNCASKIRAVFTFSTFICLMLAPNTFAQTTTPVTPVTADNQLQPTQNATTTPEADVNQNIPSSLESFMNGPLSPPTPSFAEVSTTQETAGTTTELPGNPTLGTFANEATITLNQTSRSDFDINYEFNSDAGFGGAILFFNSAGGQSQDLSGVDEFVFEAGLTSGSCVPGAPQCLKIEFLDAQNNLATILVQDVGADFTRIAVTPAQLALNNSDVDLTAIKQINFVLEGANLEPNTGTMTIRSGGIAFTPTVSPEQSAFTPTIFPGSPVFTSFEAAGATGSLQTVSPSQFLYNYDLSAAGSFAGAIVNYMETPAGSQDFSTAEAFQFNLRTNNACASLTKCLKIEFQDTTGQMAVVNVTGLNETFQGVLASRETLAASNPNLNLAAIRQINFVLEEANTSPKAGFLEVQTGPLTAGPGTPVPPGGTPPTPEPTPAPGPPSSTPTEGLITGIQNNQTVSGTIQVQPTDAVLAQAKKVAYYLNGTKAGKNYEPPFIFGGPNGFDTTKLPDGEYTLSGYVTTAEGDQTFSVTFTIENGNSSPLNLEPNQAPGGAVQGINENETVSGEVTVKPDLTQFPDIHKVFYYLDGRLIEKSYESPFNVQIDTADLEDGAHTLSGLFTVSGDDDNVLASLDHEFSITFTVNNNAA